MQCPRCKKKLSNKAVHCKHCGTEIVYQPQLEDFLLGEKQPFAKYKSKKIKIISVMIILVTLSVGCIWVTGKLTANRNIVKTVPAEASEQLDDVGTKTELQQNIISDTYSPQQSAGEVREGEYTSQQPDTNSTAGTAKQVITEVVATGSTAVPDSFVGSWAEKEKNVNVINELKIERNRIAWIRQKEDKDLVTKYDIEENGKVVSFNSKVTYSRDVFGGQAYKGEVKVKMKVRDDMLTLEIGEMKVQEQGFSVTIPSEQHLYMKQPVAKQDIDKNSETSAQQNSSEAKNESSENTTVTSEKVQDTKSVNKNKADYLNALKAGAVVLNESTKIEFVKIGIGEFDMGSQPVEVGNQKDERPVHRVTISKPFYMSKYEITQSQYSAILGNNPSSFKNDMCPVESVSWFDAQAFCRKLNESTGQLFRLPTEAEWEYTCRAGTSTSYSSGSSITALIKMGWCSYDGKLGSAKRPKPVGQFESNRWGLYDMHGNVSEWCQDWYGGYSIDSGILTNPSGPQDGTFRVVRGGSWYDDPQGCRSAVRMKVTPGMIENSIGFRIVCEIE